MISVQGVSMRFGSKVLFDDVTTTFSAGRRYGLTGPNGAGKSTFMKLLTGELPPQHGHRRPARRSSASCARTSSPSTRFRVIDTVIMGNQRLWSALEERELLYAKTDMTDADGMRLGELEGIVGEEDGYTAESDAAILLQGLDIPDALHERTMARAAGRPEGARAAGAGAVRPARRRCCSTSRPTTSTSTRSTGCASSSSATTAR